MAAKAKAKVVHVYKDGAGEYRWKAIAGNGKVVSDSGEGYKNRTYAKRIAAAVNLNVPVEYIG